jgi:hypothetical protein
LLAGFGLGACLLTRCGGQFNPHHAFIPRDMRLKAAFAEDLKHRRVLWPDGRHKGENMVLLSVFSQAF